MFSATPHATTTGYKAIIAGTCHLRHNGQNEIPRLPRIYVPFRAAAMRYAYCTRFSQHATSSCYYLLRELKHRALLHFNAYDERHLGCVLLHVPGHSFRAKIISHI
jgi:hypothetical protein